MATVISKDSEASAEATGRYSRSKLIGVAVLGASPGASHDQRPLAVKNLGHRPCQ